MARSTPKKYSAAGVPSSMTEAKLALFFGAMQNGTPTELAAAVAGIPRRTLYNWLKRGRESDEPDCPYYRFALGVEAAKGNVVNMMSSVVLDAIRSGDGHLALKALATYYPNYYGPNQTAGELADSSEEPIDLAKLVITQSINEGD